jgi:hypothetical protein
MSATPHPSSRTARRSLRTTAVALLTLLLAAGCTDGQLVDAAGHNGGGGLAFVVLVAFFGLFIAALFYMDRVRERRSTPDDDQ